jgi:hypothetical protein
VAIQSKLLKITLGDTDKPLWNSSRGTNSCAEVWDNLREKKPEVSWWKLVSFSMAIPEHAFFSWLVLRDALVTKHKMSCWGFSGKLECLFCYGQIE